MGYYQGDYYQGDPGPLETLQSKLGMLGAKERFPELAEQAAGGSGRKFTRHELATGIEESGGRHRGPRMNPLNPRALRRAMRRVQRFAKFASQTMTFTKRHKMKKRRRR